MSRDEFAQIIIIVRQGLLLICNGLEKWLVKYGYIKAKQKPVPVQQEAVYQAE